MESVDANQDSQKMPSLAARLPRPAADDLNLRLPIPFPAFIFIATPI